MKKYSVKDLQERYDLKTRQSVYGRLKAIEAQTLKEGNKTYVTEDIVNKLDQLQEHLTLGGSIKTFTPTVVATVHNSLDSVNHSLDTNPQYTQLNLFDQLEPLLNPLIDKVAEKLTLSNPINHWEKLDVAAEKRYILTSKEIETLLGTKPKGKEWKRGAFLFTCVGKIGNQNGWKVTKI